MDERRKKFLEKVCARAEESRSGNLTKKSYEELIAKVKAVEVPDEPDENIREPNNDGQLLSEENFRIIPVLEDRKDAISRKRTAARQCLERQAKKMKRDSNAKFPDPPIGATVRVPLPGVDRGKIDARSVLARVQEKTEDGFYNLATRDGHLPQLYARSQFTVSAESFLEESDIPPASTSISLRSAATKESKKAGGHGQGFVRCNCIKRCDSRRCACLKKGILCNSKCHSGGLCCNK